MLLSVLLLSTGLLIAVSNYEEDPKQSDAGGRISIPIWTSAAAWLIAVFNFIQIGVESSVGGWITTYQGRLTQSESNWMDIRRSCVFRDVGRWSRDRTYRPSSF